MLLLKNIVFTILVPGTVTVLIPYGLLAPGYEPLRRGSGPSTGSPARMSNMR